ncbi:MAG: tetratricopeptide repeat protein [Bacteroidota bacterium]|nr:tetratricopeptide repeat protein [Bacteroidota bacterium]
MNFQVKILLVMSAIFLIASCSSSEKENAQDTDQGASDMAERIHTLEDSLFENMAFDRRNAQMLMDVYKAYVSAYPLDVRAPEFLFRAAGVARSMKDAKQSIALYDRIIRDYSSWERIPDTYYLKAFTIDTELGQKGEAKEAYQKVINQFPDHPFAKDAKAMIANLEYTDEELIARFKQMEAQDTSAAAAN